MAVRRGWLGLCLICFGCHSLPPLETEPPTGASQNWEKGQAAMRREARRRRSAVISKAWPQIRISRGTI